MKLPQDRHDVLMISLVKRLSKIWLSKFFIAFVFDFQFSIIEIQYLFL